LQAAEALKILAGHRDAINPSLVTIDVWGNVFQSFAVKRRLDCDVCAHRRFRSLSARQDGAATALCGRNAVQITAPAGSQVNLADLETRLAALGPVRRNAHLLRFEPDGFEVTVFPDGRAIVKGTDDPARARALYAKFIGA
ncbi:MAG: thiazole biosynthesis adenylyltransferase ThiF, partial [Planctomycetes bacterium]|nr:thiazole biosynthesis adenylyltransferase ThiF [Planctomycetota bacterium]